MLILALQRSKQLPAKEANVEKDTFSKHFITNSWNNNTKLNFLIKLFWEVTAMHIIEICLKYVVLVLQFKNNTDMLFSP